MQCRSIQNWRGKVVVSLNDAHLNQTILFEKPNVLAPLALTEEARKPLTYKSKPIETGRFFHVFPHHKVIF